MSHRVKNLKEVKIIFAGLDNAGKTSALIALRQKYNFHEKVKNLKPTIKIDYSSFTFVNRYSINLWDMGGQGKYRSIYVNNPVYFSGTDYLYFLIDIQDEFKFRTSVDYLSELLKIFRELDYENEIIICFHKYDPKFKGSQEFRERTKMIKELILKRNPDIQFVFFNTSVYDISSISKAVSYSLNQLLDVSSINAKLRDLTQNYGCHHAILYTNAGLIIADNYSEVMDPWEFQKQISSKMNENLEFFQRLTDEDVGIDERLICSDNTAQYVKKYTIEKEHGSIILYLEVSTYSDNLKPIKAELDKIQSHLETII
ncbi:MAG: ADP-ribosylation factor-like protein [Promethearchaeia archaeon]